MVATLDMKQFIHVVTSACKTNPTRYLPLCSHAVASRVFNSEPGEGMVACLISTLSRRLHRPGAAARLELGGGVPTRGGGTARPLVGRRASP